MPGGGGYFTNILLRGGGGGSARGKNWTQSDVGFCKNDVTDRFKTNEKED